MRPLKYKTSNGIWDRLGYLRQWKLERKLALLALRGGKCVDCGYRGHPAALDFDHVRGRKKFDISKQMHGRWELLVAEAKKCDIRCANCHRIVTNMRVQNG